MSDLPVMGEDQISAIYSALEKMDVSLDADPLQYGPKRLNAKVAKVRALLSQCERIYLQVSGNLRVCRKEHRAAQLDFDLQMQDLLANDPEVKAGRNVRDRDALATMKLRGSREKIMKLEVAIQDLEMVLTVIKAKRADLRDIQGRLRDQIKLCQEEVGLGARWGSRPSPGEAAPNIDAAPKVNPSALSAVQDLLVEDSEVDLEAGDSSWMLDSDPGDEDPDEKEILAELERQALADRVEDEDETDPSLDVTDMDEVEVGSDEVDLDAPRDDVPVSPSEVIPEVASDVEVDSIFEELKKEEASRNKPVTEDVDLDDLLGMLG